MNASQFKNRSLHINKFQSLTPERNERTFSTQQQQIFNFCNSDHMTERKFVPTIQTKYKPYSCLRKMQLHIIGDYFNSTIERQQLGKHDTTTPKKRAVNRIYTEPQQSPKIVQWIPKSELKQFSMDLPIVPVMQAPKQTILKKKKGVQGFRILLK